MSSVIAMIYNSEICLASDMKSTDHETGQEMEPSVKQIVLNDEIAIGFTGSGNIAQVIMDTLVSPKNEHIVSNLTFNEIPSVLDHIYQSHTAKKEYPDEEMRHVSALIAGTNNRTPEIVRWDSSGTTEIIKQKYPGSFTAVVFAPYDVEQTACNKILLDIAEANPSRTPLDVIASEYFNIVSSISIYVSSEATIWKHNCGIIGFF